MKPRFSRLFPRHLVVVFGAPLLAASTASAAIINFNEQSTSLDWALPAGPNLLAGATPTPATASAHEGSSTSWATLTNGQLGTNADKTQSVTPNNNETVTFALDLTGKPGGYNIAAFDSYCGWPDAGRDNQNFTIEYSTVANPTTFVALATVANTSPGTGAVNSTHTSLRDTTGVLASGVHSIRLTFANQENTWTGFRELVLREAPLSPVVNVLNEANSTNDWTLPSGANLLNGSLVTNPASPAGSNHGNGDITSSSWTTLTNGAIGAPAVLGDSVAPNNNTSVIFPLDLTVNVNGYNLSSLDTYCAWQDSGRDNQNYTVYYSTVANPGVFQPIAMVANQTANPLKSTHTRITPGSGFLATNVAALKFFFNNQENGYVGYREFIAQGTAVSLSDPLTWTGNSGSAGNANWVATADNNWKKTSDGTAANFNALAPVTFDATGNNRNITVSSALTTSSVTIANNGSTAYTFGGQQLTTTNDLAATGSGTATFANSVVATTGVTQSGSGSLVFNGSLQSPGMIISGTGAVVLNAANPGLTGTISMSNGALDVANDTAMELASLSMSGGTASFTTSSPLISSLAGTGGSVVLGKTAGAVSTTLFIGDPNPVSTSFAGNISNASGTTGSILKVGNSTLLLSGDNTYAGPTTVQGGKLEFGGPLSLYHGNTAAWTATNIVAEGTSTIAFRAGGAGQFTGPDLNLIALDGFQDGTFLGIDTTADVTLTRNLTRPGLGLVKSGGGILTLTGSNTLTGQIILSEGTLNLANPSGASIPGNIQVGDNTDTVFLNMGADNQFGPDSVITMSASTVSHNAKMNLRGTTQTVAGLDSTGQRVSLIQNDEADVPGYVAPSGAASLIINAASDHVFQGLIRDNGNGVTGGGAVSVTKNGPGTQEFRSNNVQGFGYTGPTIVNGGKLLLSFGTVFNGFGSNITVNSGASLELRATAINYNFDRLISGPGPVLVTGNGVNAVIFRNGSNAFTGGVTVDGGFLAMSHGTGTTPGAGNAAGQTCVAGAMTPSNLVNVINNGILSLDNAGALGQSTMLPEFGPSVRIGQGSRLAGGVNTVAFVPNLTLDGGLVDIHDGATTGGFNTNLCFVGTVVVGGSSSAPSTISTSGTGANANASLGSAGLPGTTFQVADATGNADVDLVVSSSLRDVSNLASPLVKTGPGTMSLTGNNVYTGATTVAAGELQMTTAALADAAGLRIDSGATLNLLHALTDTVNTLTLNGAQVAAGIYGSTTNATPGIIQTPRITGTGLIQVTTGPGGGDPYTAWASVITNPADRDKTDDPDGDGFTNLQEYLLGGSPIVSNGSLVTSERSGANIIIRWAQRNSGGVYTLQESTNLVAPWTASLVTIGNAVDQSNLYSADYTRKEASIPIDVVRKFARIQAVTSP